MYRGRLIFQDDIQAGEEVTENLCSDATPHHLAVCNANLVTDGHDDSHAATVLTTHDPGGARSPTPTAARPRVRLIGS